MVFPFLVIRLKSGMYIQIPQKKQIINADWLRWVGDDMLSIYIVFLISLRSTYGMQAYLSAPPRYCGVSRYIWITYSLLFKFTIYILSFFVLFSLEYD